MFRWVPFIFFFATSCVYAQEVVYFNERWTPASGDSATYTGMPQRLDNMYFVRFFRKDSTIAREGHYKDLKSWERVGELKNYNDKGVLIEETMYKEGKRHGYSTLYNEGKFPYLKNNYSNGELHDTSKTFYPDGTLKRYEYYNNGTFISGKVYKKNGADTTFYRMEEPAAYVGGQQALREYLGKYINYPKEARQKNIQGRVMVKFVIDETGKVVSADAINHVDPLLDQAAIDLVKGMPDWIPARMDGKPVRCYFNLPISFKLTDN